jgi:quinol monooxygenase YgiN
MAIKTIIELQAKTGQRDALLSIMHDVTTTMQAVPGFLGYTFYEVLDNPSGLIEIAEWESLEARATWIKQSMDSGALNPLMDSLVAPFKATNIRQTP